MPASKRCSWPPIHRARRWAIADERDMPVLRLAPSASLIDAERAIVSLIVDRESQLRRRVEQIYERLLTTLVDDGGIAALAAEVADVTRRPTVVLDEYSSPGDCARG